MVTHPGGTGAPRRTRRARLPWSRPRRCDGFGRDRAAARHIDRAAFLHQAGGGEVGQRSPGPRPRGQVTSNRTRRACSAASDGLSMMRLKLDAFAQAADHTSNWVAPPARAGGFLAHGVDGGRHHRRARCARAGPQHVGGGIGLDEHAAKIGVEQRRKLASGLQRVASLSEPCRATRIRSGFMASSHIVMTPPSSAAFLELTLFHDRTETSCKRYGAGQSGAVRTLERQNRQARQGLAAHAVRASA
jgi:hypothetical protein